MDSLRSDVVDGLLHGSVFPMLQASTLHGLWHARMGMTAFELPPLDRSKGSWEQLCVFSRQGQRVSASLGPTGELSAVGTPLSHAWPRMPGSVQLHLSVFGRYSSPEEGRTVDPAKTWFDCGSCARLVCALAALRLIEVQGGVEE